MHEWTAIGMGYMYYEMCVFIRAFVANFFFRIVEKKKVATNARMNSHRYGFYVL